MAASQGPGPTLSNWPNPMNELWLDGLRKRRWLRINKTRCVKLPQIWAKHAEHFMDNLVLNTRSCWTEPGPQEPSPPLSRLTGAAWCSPFLQKRILRRPAWRWPRSSWRSVSRLAMWLKKPQNMQNIAQLCGIFPNSYGENVLTALALKIFQTELNALPGFWFLLLVRRPRIQWR